MRTRAESCSSPTSRFASPRASTSAWWEPTGSARQARRGFFGVGLGTDTNGFSSLPGPPPNAARRPLRYPFRSYDGSVSFTRQRTGTRTFDLNTDGVAQYGLIADLIADMPRTGAGRRALGLLFNSAQAYVEAWQRAAAHR
jgi:hypothetical protein